MPDPYLNTDRDESGLITEYHPRLTKPTVGNKYYIRQVDGGWNGCIQGHPVDSECNVLSNCIGYANGRFNEIGEYGECRYQFVRDAWRTYQTAIDYGLKVGSTPALGAIMVWSGGSKGAGHVAIVEKVNSSTSVQTSESAYGSSAFYSRVRDLGSDGRWGSDDRYTFTGFVYNPAVAGYATLSNEITNTGGSVTYDQSNQISENSSLLYKNQSIFSTQKVSTDVTRDTIIHVDREYNDISSQSNNLLSYPSLVEAPYILVKIGDYTFGQYTEKRSAGKLYKTYPNYITSLDVLKINGQVNVYTIKMLYQVQYLDDPNFLDKIFSSVGYGKIKISYGDFASPSFIYKEEEAIITKVNTNVDFSSSKIEYTISCTSSALSAQGTNFPFPRHAKEKPSKVIKSILEHADYYHLTNIFPGLTGKNLEKNFYKFIATDDLAVEIPAQQYMDPISYINYLVSCMIPQEDTVSDTTRSATYYMTIHDDSYADYSNVGGTYFKVTKILSTYKTLPTFNTYTVDVGYPGGDHPGENLVMNFQLKDDNSWALLYDYSQSDIGGSQQNYSYSINNSGQVVRTYSPNITVSAVHGKTTPAMKAWWTRMTEFPISATLTIKGLVRAAMLMTYLRVNTYFYGKKHVSSGLYVITKQEDRIDGSGYRTTLSLTRIAGEDEYIERKKYTQVSELITGVKDTTPRKIVPIANDTTVDWGEIVNDVNELKGMENIRYLLPAGSCLYVLTLREDATEGTPPIFTDPNQPPLNGHWFGDLYQGIDYNSVVVRPLGHGTLEDYDIQYTEQDIIAYPTEIGALLTIYDQEGNKEAYQGSRQFDLVKFEIGGQVYFHPLEVVSYDDYATRNDIGKQLQRVDKGSPANGGR